MGAREAPFRPGRALRLAKGSAKYEFHARGLARRLRSNVKPPACLCLLVPYMPLARNERGSFPAVLVVDVANHKNW